ncbi:sensor histidine kinase [Spirulina sp. 06S082]|uniref:sensor histidine kinase n=1 Tax=Spirulina sp. 06S082 TaxID=3110248 RepID=UPI002B2139A2|nr:ATP-binding protein [Spirulina sp. 06S082]MEA5468316.1 ATP-binding protein [Spirulina sp. 06S082]
MQITFSSPLSSPNQKIDRFQLIRYFSIASLTAFSIVIVVLGEFYRQQSIKILIEKGEENNVALAKSFSNTIWSEFSDFVDSTTDLSNEELKSHPETELLRQKILNQMEGLPVVKVKVFSLSGRIIFSTEPKQIGDYKEDYSGFIAARSGQLQTKLGHRETFSAFAERIQDRQLLSSYVPIQRGRNSAEIEGVLELYSDVTPLYTKIGQLQRSVTLVCTLILSILYLVLFLIVKRADRIIQTQHQDLQISEQRYKVQADELKQAQSQLVQNEKMSGLGKMVAGLAHEINNPVSFIHGNIAYVSEYVADLLKIANVYQNKESKVSNSLKKQLEDIDLDFLIEDLPKCLKSMQVGTERIRELILSLRIFSRLDEVGIKKVDLHQGIESVLLILSSQLNNKITISKQYGDLPMVACYPVQINQVFMNILSNAIDALLAQTDNENKQIEIVTQTRDGDRVQILIRDNGPGIAPEIQAKIFDPFFTTKAIGKGTGLGLSICYEIMQKHHGELRCHSRGGGGTEFTIALPIEQTL